MPGTANAWQTAIRPDDLETLTTGITKILRSSRLATSGLETRAEVFTRHGIDNDRDQIAVGIFLTALEEFGVLTVRRVPDKRTGCARKWIIPRRYDPHQLDHYLAGRSLIELAREFRQGKVPSPPPETHLTIRKATAGTRGPDKTERTAEIEEHCYDSLKAGLKRLLIARDVRAKFNLPAFGEASVTTYARRKAKRPDDPRPWPINR